jgi:hypothetical protein
VASSQDLRIRYIGDASGVQNTIRQLERAHAGLGSKLKAVGSQISGVGKSLTVGLTLPLVGFGAMAVSEFGEASRVAAQTDAVLRSTGGAAGVTADHVADLATKLGQLSAQDNEVIASGANMLLTFTNIRNEAGKGNDVFDQAVATLTDLSAAMGTEPKQAAIQLGKALNDPVKGITALTRVGVTFTEQQKRQIEAMVKHGRTAEAQKVILAELDKEFGGSAAAAGKSATPIQRLTLIVQDLAESVGEVLAPMLEQAAAWTKRLADWFNGLSPEAKDLAVKIGLVAAAIGPVLIVVGKLTSAIGTLMPVIKGLFALVSTNPWVLIVAATIALVIVIVKNWDKIKAVIFAVWEKIRAFVGPVWNAIKRVLVTVWNAIKAAVMAYFNIYKRVILAVWTVVRTVSGAVWGAIKRVLLTVWAGIKAYAQFYWNLIKTVIITPAQWLQGKLVQAFTWVKERLGGLWRGLVEIARGVWDTVVGIFKGGANAVISAINWMIDQINKVQIHIHVDPPGPGSINFDWNGLQIPHITPLARGGLMARAGLALVGEQGPELVALPAGSRVFSNRASRDLAGRGMVVVVNVEGSVTAERDLAETIRRELLRAARRNGGSVGLA